MYKPTYYGSATVGERGQMVIPADARKALGIDPGDKMVIFGHGGGQRLVMMKAEMMTQYVSQALGDLAALEAKLREDFSQGGESNPPAETSK
jgi:AbrB family looped-hinge helix DNA binding protein